MNSCDTFALTAKAFSGGANILCKNSDRPLGEAQPPHYYPRRQYGPEEQLQCTHLTIPQTDTAWAVLGCQPYWIWGFGCGVNEWGLAIGNEAQGSRCEAESQEGLLGMDMLRLALERAKTAREGVDVISGLLERYGQNANASMLFDRRYENSFMLVDPQEIWLLETAGRQWVARRVEDRASISNCYSIGTQFDLSSENLESYARDRRWLAPDEPLNFAKAYTDPAVRQRTLTPRWRRLCSLTGEGVLDEEKIKSVLRDHFEGEIIEPRFGAAYGCFVTICMHAMTWDSSQTTCAFLAHWEETLGVVTRYCAGIPCSSVFIPVYMTGILPECMTRGGAKYDPESLWWCTERLAMAVSVDEDRFGPYVRQQLRTLEAQICDRTKETEARAKELILAGQKEEAQSLLVELTQHSADCVLELVRSLCEDVLGQIGALGGIYGPRKGFLEAYCNRTDLPL